MLKRVDSIHTKEYKEAAREVAKAKVKEANYPEQTSDIHVCLYYKRGRDVL